MVKTIRCKHRGCNGCTPGSCPGARKCKPYRAASRGNKYYPTGVDGRDRCKHRGCDGCTPESCPGAQKCKSYAHARAKARYMVNPAQSLARLHAWNQAHPDRSKARSKSWGAAHRELVKARSKAWYAANIERATANGKLYYNATYIPVGDIKGVIHPDGSFTKTRSMSEAYFLLMLDDNDLSYQTEVPLRTPIGKYIADIYLPTLNIFVEVKADRWVRDDQMAKIEYLREQGLSIIILDSDLIDDEFGF